MRFDYGRVRPWVTRQQVGGHEVIVATGGPDKLMLRGPRLPHAADGHHVDEFDLAAGDEMTFSTTWVRSWRDLPEPLPFDDRIEATRVEHENWASRCGDDVPHADLVRRSLLTLRLLTHEETGGIVAAPTTSLPEDFGGERNWDYRFCWLRDAALTLESLLAAGYTEEARDWRNWLLRAVAGDPEDLQIMYTVDGGRQLPERELPHLAGYEDSTPGAHRQRRGRPAPDRRARRGDDRARGRPQRRHRPRRTQSWALQRSLVEELAEHWDEPDNGLWEIRGDRSHFTHSRVMVWVAFDRAIKAVEEHGLAGPVERWRDAARAGAGGDPGQGVRRRTRHLHPALRHPRGRREPAQHLAGGLPARRRRAGPRHHPGDRGGPDAPRLPAPLPHPDRRRRPARATSTRSWRARSGWSRPTPRRAAATTRTS